MKRILLVIFALLTLSVFAGCSATTQPVTEPSDDKLRVAIQHTDLYVKLLHEKDSLPLQSVVSLESSTPFSGQAVKREAEEFLSSAKFMAHHYPVFTLFMVLIVIIPACIYVYCVVAGVYRRIKDRNNDSDDSLEDEDEDERELFTAYKVGSHFVIEDDDGTVIKIFDEEDSTSAEQDEVIEQAQ